MKNKTLLILLLLISLGICLNACKNKTEAPKKDASSSIPNTKEIKSDSIVTPQLEKKKDTPASPTSKLKPNTELEYGKTYTDTITFISYDDNYDYWYFLAKKSKDTIAINYTDEAISQLVKGDNIVIDWEMKRLEEAGDEDITYVKPYLISFKKINSSKSKENIVTSKLRPNTELEFNKTYTDTITFISNDDNSDYWYFLAEKNKDSIRIYYHPDKLINQLAWGDKTVINWKMISYQEPADDEITYVRPYLISFKKINSYKVKKEKVKILWSKKIYEESVHAEVLTLILNEGYLKIISDPQKAALAYVTTFIGNECEWDGKVNEDRSNLKCKLMWALDLGYQCSEEHLEFLNKWFSKDVKALEKLKKCRKTHNTATIQTLFDKIFIETNTDDKTIQVSYEYKYINVREGSVSNYTKTDTFTYDSNSIIHMNTENSSLSNTSTNKSFIISCGSGCAMTYSENKIVANANLKEVIFKVEMHINEIQDDEYFETYIFNCETSNEKAIQLKGNEKYKIEEQHPEIQKKLKSYLQQICKN